MADRIEKLTPEQEAEIPRLRERWRALGSATDPIDADTARRAVHDLYRAAGMADPAAVIVLASPMACLVAHAFIERFVDTELQPDRMHVPLQETREEAIQRHWRQLQRPVGSHLRIQLGEQLKGELSREAKLQLEREISRQLGAEIRDPLRTQLAGHLRAPLEDQLWEQLRDRFWEQVHRQLGRNFWDRLRAELGGHSLRGMWAPLIGATVLDRLMEEIGPHAIDRLWDRFRDQFMREGVWRQIGDLLGTQSQFIGAQDAFWLAFYEFSEQLGVRYKSATKAHFEAYKTYARTCGWLYPYPSVAFVSDRPQEIHLDAARRPHSATGMAVKFRDGWGVHAWHGLRVPAHLIEDRASITPASIEAEANAELRRVALEIYGFEKYLAERGATVIAQDELHGQKRRLLEVTIAGAPVRIIEVVNGSPEPDGTRRKFHLGAMPGDTPHDAVAASYGINPAVYRESVRT